MATRHATPSENSLIRSFIPTIRSGETNVTRVARMLTRRGGPLEHRNFSAMRNKLRRLRNEGGR